jgi:hypothetical protein
MLGNEHFAVCYTILILNAPYRFEKRYPIGSWFYSSGSLIKGAVVAH